MSDFSSNYNNSALQKARLVRPKKKSIKRDVKKVKRRKSAAKSDEM